MPAPHTKQSIIDDLHQAAAYPHAAENIQLLETHISWVFLAGEYAYKIKKPVALGFLDFRELQSRKHFCAEEVRLNQPWAPQIYLGVVRITLVDGKAKIDGTGKAIEYAVKMRRFDQALRLDRQLEEGLLSCEDMRELAANIADRHCAAEVVPDSRRDRVLELTESQMLDNFKDLRPYLDDAVLRPLHAWTRCEIEKLHATFAQRFDQGFYRDCHGDLHLGNLVRLPGGIATFDCIEFSADLRHIDVACDVAFLVMDLESKARNDLAAHFLNRYFEKTDDYDSMRLFNAYFIYRCLVRAKVAALRAAGRNSTSKRQVDIAEAEAYCNMATRQSRERRPRLIVMHGLSGSGKTWLAERLMAALPAIRVRSDLLRKRLFGLAETDQSGSGVAEGIYASDTTIDVYREMRIRATAILQSGHDVILDATFLRREDRSKACDLAAKSDASFVIVRATAEVAELRRRIEARARQRSDPSEANLAVLEYQLGSIEELTDTECLRLISVDSSDVDVIDGLLSDIRRLSQHN